MEAVEARVGRLSPHIYDRLSACMEEGLGEENFHLFGPHSFRWSPTTVSNMAVIGRVVQQSEDSAEVRASCFHVESALVRMRSDNHNAAVDGPLQAGGGRRQLCRRRRRRGPGGNVEARTDVGWHVPCLLWRRAQPWRCVLLPLACQACLFTDPTVFCPAFFWRFLSLLPAMQSLTFIQLHGTEVAFSVSCLFLTPARPHRLHQRELRRAGVHVGGPGNPLP